MINQPLNSAEQSKILIFFLLLLPLVLFFGFGALPALFLCIGIFMMKRNEDFSYIRTSVKICNWYGMLTALGLVTLLLFSVIYYQQSQNDRDWYKVDEITIPLIFLSMAIIYLILLNVLFARPLVTHWQWVEANGVFASKQKNKNIVKESEIDIIKSESLRSYSVADELIKWAKLKEDGYISEEEFKDARDKLLQRK